MIRFVLLILVIAGIAVGAYLWTSSSPPTAPFDSIKKAVLEQEPDHVWEALPNSYRSDLSTIVSQLRDRVHPEAYDQASNAISILGQVLHEKSEFIVGSSMARGFLTLPSNQEPARAVCRTVGAMILTLTESALGTHATLKQVDPETLSSGPLSKVIRKLGEWIQHANGGEFDWDRVQFEVVQSQGDQATVEFKIQPSADATKSELDAAESPTRWEMIRVENRWVPSGLADSWDTTVGRFRRAVEGWKPGDQARTVTYFLRWQKTLEPLLSAKNQIEFDRAIPGILGILMFPM